MKLSIYNCMKLGQSHSLQERDLPSIVLQEEILRKEGRKEGAEYKMTVMTRKELRDKQSSDSPAKAEESQVEAQQSGHHMSNERTGLTGVEVEPKPHSHQQGEQLTCHKVNLHRGTHKHSVTDVWNQDESRMTDSWSWVYARFWD